METIQQKYDWDCLAAVTAMATRTSLDDVLDFLPKTNKKRKALYTEEIMPYLFIHGFVLGAEIPIPGKIKNIPPAFLGVGDGINISHAVYWDGKQIRDSSGFFDGIVDFTKHKKYILQWIPLLSWIYHKDKIRINKSKLKNFQNFQNFIELIEF